MITGSASQEHVPFGRFVHSIHPGSTSRELSSHSLSEGVNNISINDIQQVNEGWQQRHCLDTDGVEELYYKDRTVIWSSVACSTQNATSKIIKTYTVQGKVQNAFWCTFLLLSNEANADSAKEIDKIQSAICVVETNAVSIFTTTGDDHQVSLPFHVAAAWPMERGIIFQRSLEDKHTTEACSQMPIWFSMLHPLGDLSPVICKSGSQLNYVTSNAHHLVHISAGSPYIAVVYDNSTQCHSMHIIRRTVQEEEITYTDLAANSTSQVPMDTSRRGPGITQSTHTPSRTGFLSLSSILSPNIASPRGGYHLRSPSLRSANYTASPSTSKLAALSANSPSLASIHHLAVPQRHTMSPSASVAHSPFTTSGYCANQAQDLALQADFLEPIRPDMCLQHVWTDHYSCASRASRVFFSSDFCGQTYLCFLIPAAAELRCIKIGMSNSADGSVIFGTAVNIAAKDACPCPALGLILILDLESNLYLYSGTTQISQVYIPRLSYSSQHTALTTPQRRGSLLTSSRPPSAKEAASSRPPSAAQAPINFDTEEGAWSPVEMELSDSMNFNLNQSSVARCISAITSVVKRHAVVTLLNGEMCRTSLPELSSNSAVTVFISALSSFLPYADAISVISKWYTYNNMSGNEDIGDELGRFFMYILDSCGFPAQAKSALLQTSSEVPSSPKMSKKRAKTVHEPSELDWNYLVDSPECHFYKTYAHLLGLDPPEKESIEPLFVLERSKGISEECYIKFKLDSKSILSHNVHAVLLLLHNCYEEMKLNTLYAVHLERVARFLLKFARVLKLASYERIYLMDFPPLADERQSNQLSLDLSSQSIKPPQWFPQSVQSTSATLETILLGLSPPVFYYLPHVTNRIEALVKLYTIYKNRIINYTDVNVDFMMAVPVVGRKMGSMNVDENLNQSLSCCDSTEELILLLLCKLGFSAATLDTLPLGMNLVLREALYTCQGQPSTHWSVAALRLINREDMVVLAQGKHQEEAISLESALISSEKSAIDGMECLDDKILKMRWRDDLRLVEVKRCLRSSLPVRICLTQKPEVSDHNFIEEKERHLLALSPRTMALPLARGMLTLRCYRPVLTEQLKIPTLCLTGKVYPTQSAVELSSDTTASLSVWPAFHNGAAAGLCLDTKAEVDSTWILYNKPKENTSSEQTGYMKNLTSEHAGFLMALGLNGHLHSLAESNLHDYLIKGHEMTAIGVLLGLAATMRGTMDIPTVRLLTIHIPALLPASSTQLDISHNARIAAIFGIGLLYHNSAHRHIAGVLLREIDHLPGQTKDLCTDRESYSLSSGLALGMVMQGKGGDVTGLNELNIANQLCLLVLGGHRTPDMMTGKPGPRQSSSGQVYEGELINTDVTSAGATLALGLVFFNLSSRSVCDWLKIPDTLYLLEFVRPDLLQLRIIARNLVCWSDIVPTQEWVESQIPEIVSKKAFERMEIDDSSTSYETLSQAYCYLVSGACFSVALKFAGSSNRSAYNCLLFYTRKFLDLHQKVSKVDQAGKPVMENALCVCLLSLAMVMSGSGDLEVLRICRFLRSRIGTSHVNYGSHMAVHMSLSLLFLGSGRYTLSSRSEVIPFLLAAFFPKFPSHSNDNRYHLQALRHLYALAAEPRLLLTTDVDSREPCYVPLEITLRQTDYYEMYSYTTYAPCILPSLDLVRKISIIDKRYWPIMFNLGGNLDKLSKLLETSGVMMVKRRAGHLDYNTDPQGIVGAMSRALMLDSTDQDCEESWLQHGYIGNFPRLFLSQEMDYSKGDVLLKTALRECLTNEKAEVLLFYLTLHQMLDADVKHMQGLSLQYLQLVSTYCKKAVNCAVNKDLFYFFHEEVKQKLFQLIKTEGVTDSLLNYANGEHHRSLLCSKAWLYMAFRTDIDDGCIAGNVCVPTLMGKLGFPLQLAKQVQDATSKRPK